MVGPKRASHDVWSGVGSKFLSSDAVNGSEREFHKTAECESITTVGEIRVWCRADFQSGSRVLKKVF